MGFKYTVEATDACRRTLTVTIPAQDVQRARALELQKLVNSKPCNGFRRGSPVYEIFIAQQHGKAIQIAVLDSLQKTSFQDKLQQEAWTLASAPVFERLSEETLNGHTDFQYRARFEIYPEIPCPILSEAPIERLRAEISEADVAAEIEKSRAHYQVWRAQRPPEESSAPNFDEMMAQAETQQGEATLGLAARVRQWMEARLEAAQRQHARKQVVESLLAQNPLDTLPPALIASYQAAFNETNRSQSHAASDSLQTSSSDFSTEARREACLDVLLESYRRAHNIQLDPERLKARIQEMALSFGQDSNLLLQTLLGSQALRARFDSEVLKTQILDHMLQAMQHQDKTISYAEAVGPKEGGGTEGTRDEGASVSTIQQEERL